MIHTALGEASARHGVSFTPVNTGYAESGVDLGSPWFETLKAPKAIMLLGNGVSSYEAGEVWHLLDTRVGLPITKSNKSDFLEFPLVATIP